MSNNEQKFEIEAAGKKFKFTVGRDTYNKYINSMNTKDKVAPSHNFLMSIIDDTQRAELRQVLKENAGSEIEIAGAIYEAYTPDLGIVVKKLSSEPSE